jgi:hypothetical protein
MAVDKVSRWTGPGDCVRSRQRRGLKGPFERSVIGEKDGVLGVSAMQRAGT